MTTGGRYSQSLSEWFSGRAGGRKNHSETQEARQSLLSAAGGRLEVSIVSQLPGCLSILLSC